MKSETVGNTPEEFAAVIKSDIAKMRKVVKDEGIGLEGVIVRGLECGAAGNNDELDLSSGSMVWLNASTHLSFACCDRALLSADWSKMRGIRAN